MKLIAAWEARDDVTRTEVRRHWDEHVPLANRIHVGCAALRAQLGRCVGCELEPSARPYQGFAFQYFRTQQDLVERSFDRPESRAIIEADVADFLASCDVLLATEYVFE